MAAHYSVKKLGFLCFGTLVAGLVYMQDAQSHAGQAYGNQILEYQILKDGEVVGGEKVAISDTADGQTVHISTESNVSVLFLKFHYDHDRTEIWHDQQLVSVQSRTDDDGSNHSYQATYTADCYDIAGKRVATRHNCNNAWPLTLWREDTMNKRHLYSVIDASPLEVSTQKIGTENLSVGTQTLTANHYVMTGDIKRDCWYGENGILIKTSFKKSGYDIDFVLVGSTQTP